MRKIFTFLLSVLFVSTLSAQDREAYISKATEVPVIGGDIDAAWDQAEKNNIDLIYIGENGPETPTVGEEGETYWKALWNEDGIYVLVYVADNDYYPYYQRDDTSDETVHVYDNVEVFIDANFIKDDGGGGRPGGNNGHYQFIPGHVNEARNDDAELYTYTNGDVTYDYSINASNDPEYFYEYFIPWSTLKDAEGIVDPTVGFGFEVAVADNDSPGGADGRERMVWSNNLNGGDDSWDNMDDAGLVYFEDYETVYIDEIILTGGDITEDNQTLEIGVEFVTQGDATPTDKTLEWIVSEESTARFKLEDGVLIPVTDGSVTLYAYSESSVVESNEITINITGQRVAPYEVSYIVDGYNMDPQEDGRPNAAWVRRGDGYENHTVWVQDGVFLMSSDSMLADPWNVKVRQVVDKEKLLTKQEDTFVAAWKMWAAEETAFQLVLEQRDSWAHWGNNSATTTPDVVEPVEGQTRWNLTVTSEPTWYEISFIPDNLDEEMTYDFAYQIGTTGGVEIFMDSLYMIEAADFDMIDWEVSSKRTSLAETTLNVYPNPATDRLNVSVSGAGNNSRIAIYNSVGLKMEEIEVVGNHHVVDVSNYSPGLYFVKSNDKVVKFVR